MMQYPKHDLITKLGEPVEENVRIDPADPGKPMSVLRWECGCGATKLQDDPLWQWQPGDCGRHRSGLPVT